uniref:ATP-grasp fold succinyl-CoA synthetase-type domain-containing protein n=1 Tax=Panagrolaimus sp. JU765 TaxID=591449 RepID=A0AC34Q462_9BILA
MNRSCLIPKPSYVRVIQNRLLNLQEYQSYELLDRKGCRIPRFVVAETTDEVTSKLDSFTHKEYVVKAQILAGGRGKGRFINGPSNLGGVLITEDKKAVIGAAEQMIGKRLVTKQTSADGVLVNKVMIAESLPIKREAYLAILMDRESNGPVVVCSFAGGMNIEEVAQKTPEYILKVPVDINAGITTDQCYKIAEFLKFTGELQSQAANEIKKLYELFIKIDATQIEINPFAETSDNRIFSIDAKFNFDDSASFRQKEIFAMDNHEGQDPREVEAKKYHLNYIQMDGNIAC